jgi:hypothetical protein
MPRIKEQHLLPLCFGLTVGAVVCRRPKPILCDPVFEGSPGP